MDAPVVLLHGFSNEQALVLMRAAKKAAAETGLDPASIAFAMTTPTNVEWKVADLLTEVADEHDYMRKNPPGGTPGGARMA
jgi:hypothetical protein